MSSWARLLADFDQHLRARNRRPGTIRLYRYRLQDVAAAFPKPETITLDHLEQRLAHPGWAPDTRKSVRTAYRTFFGWAHRTGRLPSNPAADLQSVSVPAGVPRPASDLVIRASLRTASHRERFMVLLGAYAGLRCCEIAALHSSWWDGRVLHVTGKGGKRRDVPIVRAELVDVLDELQGYAFPNRWTGEPITSGHVSRLLSTALAETATGHMLRHRFGTVTCETTRDIQAVADVMGHAHIETTRRYCKVGQDRLLAVAAAAAA